tara:strand:+ start:480 stop:875 length:396 start_codon:yes stop_codon:yes gene_type:complete
MAEKQGELLPEDKPKRKLSTNPRAVNARRKRAQKKADVANQSENERMLNRQRREWDEYNKQVQKNRNKLRVPNIDPQDDWQTNPDFNREKGGWKPEGQYRSLLRILQAVPAKASGLVKVGSLLIGGGGMYR